MTTDKVILVEMSDNMLLAMGPAVRIRREQDSWITREDDTASDKQLLHLFISDDSSEKLLLPANTQMFYLYEDIHICGVCHQQFVDLISFLHHKTTHALGQDLYRCDLCTCVLSANSDLIQHYNSHHHLSCLPDFITKSVSHNVHCTADLVESNSNATEMLQQSDSEKMEPAIIKDITLCVADDDNVNIVSDMSGISKEHADYEIDDVSEVVKSARCSRTKKLHRTLASTAGSMSKPTDATGQKVGRRPTTVISVYPCPVCGKIFRRLSYLRKHVETHGAAHACDVCGKTYRSRTYLRLHRRRHAKTEAVPRPRFTCSECDFTSDVAAAIHAHRQVHAPSGSVRCAICGGAYADRAALSKHRRVHDAARPFACPLPGCEWRFRTDVMCRAHVRAHTVAGRFRCATCGYVFRRKHHLQRHEARMHNAHNRYSSTVTRSSEATVTTDKPFCRRRDVLLCAANEPVSGLSIGYDPGDLIVDEDCGYTSLLEVGNIDCDKKDDSFMVDDLEQWLT